MTQRSENNPRYGTQEMLIAEIQKSPGQAPDEELLRFATEVLISPIPAIAKLAISRLLQSPTSPYAQAFARAAMADMERFLEEILAKDPLAALQRLAVVTEAAEESRKGRAL